MTTLTEQTQKDLSDVIETLEQRIYELQEEDGPVEPKVIREAALLGDLCSQAKNAIA